VWGVTSVWLRFWPQVSISLLALPVAALVAAGLARRRRARGVLPDVARRTAVAEVVMIVGTAPWIWMILTPLPAPREVYLIPFVDLAHQVQQGAGFVIAQVGGNLAVFAAFAVGAVVRWGLRVRTVAALAAVGSTTVELLQYALHLGRVTSIDDVLVNTVGAAVAAAVARRLLSRQARVNGPKRGRGSVSLDTTDLGTTR
jgi:glycopeptide antibiotics resistance protein